MVKTVCDSDEEKGDLLESLSVEFLETQGYSVQQQVSKTGTEIDLLCTNKATGKKIYVECKNRVQKPDATLIRQLVGDLHIHTDCSEVWLITTSDLNKGAKGIVDGLAQDIKNRLPIYTPDKLEEALVGAHVIKNSNLSRQKVIDVVKEENRVNKYDLLVTGRGYYYAFEILSSGEPHGYVFTDAKTSEIVENASLLNYFNESEAFGGLDCKLVEKFINKPDSEGDLVCPATFALSEEYRVVANDIGMKISHPHKDVLCLDDVFVYPAVERIDTEDREKFDSRLLGNQDCQYPKTILFGEDISGKTTLAHVLQVDLNKQGITAIYIVASDIKKSDFKSFKNLLKKNFKKQFNPDVDSLACFDKLLEETSYEVAVVIDDFELLGIKLGKARADFSDMLASNFSRVLIFCNRSLEIEAMTSSDFQWQFHGYEALRIKQLGFSLLDDLIKKWLVAGNGELMTDEEMYNKVSEVSARVRNAVGKNFVPMYPLYLLTILQFSEITIKTKIQGSSHAELYGYLIFQALASVGIKPEDLDFYQAYLSYVAFNLFKNSQKNFSQEDFEGIHKAFCLMMGLEKRLDDIQKILIGAKIFFFTEEGYRFGHNYTYYYFTARYLAENDDDVDVEEQLEKIFKYLHKVEYANVLLFLVHHSRDKKLIARIVFESQQLFGGFKPNTLMLDDVKVINDLIEKELNLQLSDKTPAEHRKEKLVKEDEKREKHDGKESASDEVDKREELNIFGALNLALKLIEIQGQLSQSYYGSLKVEQKQEIMKEVFNLGFRSLGILLEDYPLFVEGLKFAVEEALVKRGVDSREERAKVLEKVISGFTESLVMLFVRKVSDSLTSKELMIPLGSMVVSNSSPAIELVNIAVKLNFPEKLDVEQIVALDRSFEGNYLAKKILARIVYEHFYKFNVDYKIKQRLCDKLGIIYTPKKSQLGIGAQK